MNGPQHPPARWTFLIPAIATGWVLVGGGSLLLIIARSPYTHANLSPRPDPDYVRTAQITVGTPVPFAGFHGPASQPVPPSAAKSSAQAAESGAVARGRVLMVARGCATCHGLDGRGGAVGKPIAGFGADELRTQTNKGPGGMPAFDPGALSDDDLAALAAFLRSPSG